SSMKMGGVGPSYSRGTGYHALGLLYEWYLPTGTRPLLYSIRIKPNRYTYLDTHHWKWDLGAHATFGMDIFGVGVTVERVRHFDSEGRFRPAYFLTAGVEMVFASTWRKYFHHGTAP